MTFFQLKLSQTHLTFKILGGHAKYLMIATCLSLVQPGKFRYNCFASEVMPLIPDPLGTYYFGIC